MLGEGLRKLCPHESFGYAFREKKTVRKSTPEGAKPGHGGVQNCLGRPPGGSFVLAGPAAEAARKLCVGRPWGRFWDACGALGAVLGASWGVPGRSRAPLGGHVGTPQGLIWTIWALSVVQREM